MLSISSGHSAEYLTGQVAQGRENYYLDATTAGEPPGRWSGTGAAALGLVGEVDNDVMTAIYSEFRDPRDPRFADPATRDQAATLGRAPSQYKSEEQLVAERLAAEPGALPERVREIELEVRKTTRQPVMFIDATFSPVKSFTVMHTALQRAELDAQRAGDADRAAMWAAMRAEAEAALWAGNQAMLGELSARAGYARTGRHGAGAGRWVDAHDWTVASFHQSDSRDHDPQQHIHNAILNRVVCPDGQVRALDSRSIHAWKQAAGAIGERVMEEELSRRLGVRWVMRADGQAREVEGIDQAVMDLFSERAGHINRTLAGRVSEFERAHGRAPNALELSRMRQQAALGTRRAKTSAGETAADRLDRWDAELRAEVAGGLSAVAEQVREQGQARRRPAAERFSPVGVIAEAVDACQSKRAAFSRSELERQITLRLPALGGLSAPDVRELVSGLAAQAITDLVPVTGGQPVDGQVPTELRLANGESVYAAPGSVRYATRDHIVAEQALRRAAVTRGRHALPVSAVAGWLGVRGQGLGQDQAAAVRGLLTSGAAVSVLVGPAGTGKSHTVGRFTEAWSDLTGGAGRVFGLATSQIATEVLIEDGVAAMNTARWESLQGRLDDGTDAGEDETWRLGRRDVVVVDESSMVDTAVLERIRARVDAAGARLILTGDPRQLAAIGAGGGMDLVSTDHGADVYALAEVRRFTHTWEAATSLALRDGERGAVLEYDRRGRVIAAGTVEQAGHRAADAYLGDTLDGRSSLIVTATNTHAATVAGIVRDKLVELGRVDADGVLLRDENAAGVGDLIQARRNDWAAGVINRRRYRVVAIGEGGGLEVAAEDDPDSRHTLSPAYVAEHVTLGYAATAHAAQGVTVDTAHLVASQQTSAEGLYVGMSRGREANTAYVVTIAEQPGETTGQTHERERQDAAAVLVDIVERDVAADPEAAALTQAAEDAREAGSAHTLLARREDGVRLVTRQRLDAQLDQLAAAGVISADDRAALAGDKGTEQLARLLRAAEQAGHSPDGVLRAAVEQRSLAGSRSPAQVLHHRIGRALQGQLNPVTGSDVDQTPAGVTDEWRVYLAALDDAAADRRRQLGTETAEQAPAWAVDALGPVPDDAAERIEWEHRAGVGAAYREATGWDGEREAIGPAAGLSSTERRAAWHEAWAALGRPETTSEENGLTDGALRNRVQAWRRSQDWAPADVFAEMRETGQQAQARRQQAALLDARAGVATDPVEADRLRSVAEHERALAAVLADVETGLSSVADARAAWLTDTALMRELAERAETELSARDVPIGNEPDRTTPEEWLEAQRAAEAVDEADRIVTELDVIDEARGVYQGEAADVVDDGRAPVVAEHDGPVMPAGVPSPAEVAAHGATAAVALNRLADLRSAESAYRAGEISRQQEALESSREHYYRARARAELEAAETDAAPVWER
jgi:conjugative relaxase-like TrwC/TraI family protein